MKKLFYIIFLALVVVSGIVMANRHMINEDKKKATAHPLSAEERKEIATKWQASPDGIAFKKWQSSIIGQTVLTNAAKIKKHVNDSSLMEATIISTTLPPGSRLGFGVMVNINGDDFILSFGIEKSNEFDLLQKLKANDKIMIRSHFVSYAPKYAYPIVAGSYVELNRKVLYQHIPNKKGC